MNRPHRLNRRILLGVIGCIALLGGWLVAYCVTSPTTAPGDLYPGDFVGVVPDHPSIEPEAYPRLVPWELDSLVQEDDISVLMLYAQSYACNVNGDELATETFERLEVSEAADTVTIETWLGPPESDLFWRGCVGVGWGFPVQVNLKAPLGSRTLVDPACELGRYAHWIACKQSKLTRLG